MQGTLQHTVAGRCAGTGNQMPRRFDQFQLRIVEHVAPETGLQRRSDAPNLLSAQHSRGFSNQQACIALSKDLSAQFVHNGQPMTFTDLACNDLTALKAWNQAAEMMLDQVRTARGMQIHHRPARALAHGLSGIQIKVPGSVPIGSWLAHPKTISILDRFASLHLGGSPCYLLPSHDVLVAYLPDLLTESQAFGVEYWLKGCSQAVITSALMVRTGFPVRMASVREASGYPANDAINRQAV